MGYVRETLSALKRASRSSYILKWRCVVRYHDPSIGAIAQESHRTFGERERVL